MSSDTPDETGDQERTLRERLMPYVVMWGLRIGILAVFFLMVYRASIALL